MRPMYYIVFYREFDVRKSVKNMQKNTLGRISAPKAVFLPMILDKKLLYQLFRIEVEQAVGTSYL
jgi:hypothetical protein